MELNGDQWKQIHTLDQSTISTIYSLYQKPFLVEVRENLSEWIEAQFLDSNLDAYNPSHHPYILQLIGDLDAEIKSKASSAQDQGSLTVRVKLYHASNMISSGSPMDPITLFQHICHCLQTEKEILRQSFQRQEISLAQTNPILPQEQENGIMDMSTSFNDMTTQRFKITRLLSKIINAHEELVIQANTLNNVERTIQEYTGRDVGECELQQGKELDDEKNKIERWILDQAAYINKKRLVLQELQYKLLECTKIFKGKVLKCLSSWKEEQVTTSYHVMSIGQIQQWFDGLVQVIVNFDNQLNEVAGLEEKYSAMPLCARNVFESVNTEIVGQHTHSQITQLLNELFQHALIVESQPNQLVMNGKQIIVKVRLLIGRSLRLPLLYQTVHASILNETGVRHFVSINRNEEPTPCGELVNYTQKLQLDGAGIGHVAEFSNLRTKNIRQKRNYDGGSILDNSYYLIFQTKFNYNDVNHKVFALSVPIKIISHPSNDVRAWETLIWDAANKHQRSDSVPWTQLAQVLNNRFTIMTRKGLTPDKMKFVEDTALSVPGGINPINGVKYITRAQFCKTTIPELGFTFWNWFYQIAKLTSKHLCGNNFCKSGPWQDDLIIGFISQERAVEILEKIGWRGTFLLRFSESELGAIVITYLHGERDVRSISPFTTKDLTYRPLAERVLDVQNLLILYPREEKFQSFKPYVLPQQRADKANLKGYVRSELRTILIDQDEPKVLGENFSHAPGSSPRSAESENSEFSTNSIHTSSEANEHWINDYYHAMYESPDRSEDGSSLEGCASNLEDISISGPSQIADKLEIL